MNQFCNSLETMSTLILERIQSNNGRLKCKSMECEQRFWRSDGKIRLRRQKRKRRAANRVCWYVQPLIIKTHFQQREPRKWTWLAPGGQHYNMIDLILIDKRWFFWIRNCRTYHGADIGSDHSLVICWFQIRFKTIKWKLKIKY